jgi:flagellar basal body-associated protein FliL
MRRAAPRHGIALLKLIVLIVAAILLGGGGFCAWNKLRAAEETPEDALSEETGVNEEAEVVTETLSLGEFLVNLRSGDGTLRYLQTEVSIVVAAHEAEEEDGGGHGHGHGGGGDEPRLPAASHRYARDVTIEVLSSQSFESLREQPDRTGLKATLQQKLDAALESYDVHDVLFTAFVMQ